MRRALTGAAVGLALALPLGACSSPTVTSSDSSSSSPAGSGHDRCSTDELPSSATSTYELPEIPRGARFVFCETDGGDGPSANLELTVDETAGRAYLSALGLEREGFLPASRQDVANEAKAPGKGWRLDTGRAYLTNLRAFNHGGRCMMQYVAYVPDEKQWAGPVYLSMACRS
ncbi:hypothetical protein AB0F77_14180 [Streptomyces sp. NPDC026672]|uniref:hypothetical protein n=1 Tax=unclassified Streptomyces TaxID=2593676 RepID=UPI00340FA310